MTEAEWNNCEDPRKMLDWLSQSGKASERKLRLLAVACSRRAWPALIDDRSREAVQVAQRYADAIVDNADLLWELLTAQQNAAAAGLYTPSAWRPVWATDRRPDRFSTGFLDEADAAILREIVGPLLFRSLRFKAAWRTPMVIASAENAYHENQLPAGTLNRPCLMSWSRPCKVAAATTQTSCHICSRAADTCAAAGHWTSYSVETDATTWGEQACIPWLFVSRWPGIRLQWVTAPVVNT